jgi:hypothetical protein
MLSIFVNFSGTQAVVELEQQPKQKQAAPP